MMGKLYFEVDSWKWFTLVANREKKPYLLLKIFVVYIYLIFDSYVVLFKPYKNVQFYQFLLLKIGYFLNFIIYCT